jgi:hypothetical protein
MVDIAVEQRNLAMFRTAAESDNELSCSMHHLLIATASRGEQDAATVVARMLASMEPLAAADSCDPVEPVADVASQAQAIHDRVTR